MSYLFSKEFVDMLTAKIARPIVKARLIALLFSGAILAVTVGPSSAIAMRPRLDDLYVIFHIYTSQTSTVAYQ